MRAAVGAFHRQQMVARLQHREEGGGDRGHAAGRNERGLCLLQCRELAVQDLMIGRVAEPNVARGVIVRPALVEKRGRLENRHRDRAANAWIRLTGVNGGRRNALK